MAKQIEATAFSVEGLRRDADEMEACGAGNEASQMRWAADEIEHLRVAVARLRDGMNWLGPPAERPHQGGR